MPIAPRFDIATRIVRVPPRKPITLQAALQRLVTAGRGRLVSSGMRCERRPKWGAGRNALALALALSIACKALMLRTFLVRFGAGWNALKYTCVHVYTPLSKRESFSLWATSWCGLEKMEGVRGRVCVACQILGWGGA